MDLISQYIEQANKMINKKQITKLLLKNELHMFEVMPVSLEIADDNYIEHKNMKTKAFSRPPEATLTLRLYDDESISQAMSMTNTVFRGRFAIVRIPDEI